MLRSMKGLHFMARRTPIYEGKAKILYAGPEPGTLIQYFKDDATAFNNLKKGTIPNKGALNCRISERIMLGLENIGVPTHFIRCLSAREQLIRQVEIVPLEVIVRNIAAGSLCKRLGVEEGKRLPRPLIEFCLKNDALGDPLVAEEHIYAFEWADMYELEEIKMYSLRINDFLSGLFAGIGIRLVDFKIEFGRIFEENMPPRILLADEISPDSCRLWDINTGDSLDKDRFRKDLGKVAEAYREVARRLGVLSKNPGGAKVVKIADKKGPGKPDKKGKK